MIEITTRQDLLTIGHGLVIGEIGVFKGDFSKIIFKINRPKELHLFDIFTGDMFSGDKDGENIVWTNLDQEYELIKKYFSQHNNVFMHKGKSQDSLSKFSDNYFDMIYIDGDHSYEGVSVDLELAIHKVKRNGYICGHDYHPVHFTGVFNAVNDFCKKYNMNIEYISKDKLPSFCIINRSMPV